jgi:hypothetical protein
MRPTLSDVHVNRPLTNISTAYLQSLDEFVADQVFPTVPVASRSDVYYTFPKGWWFRTSVKQRGLSQESPGLDFAISTDNYVCEVQSVHKDIDDQLRNNQDGPLALDRSATEIVSRHLVLRRELDWAANYFTTGIWIGSSTGTDIVPSTKWDVYATSTPLQDIRTEIYAMHSKTGYKPNKLILAPDVWAVLQDHPDIIGRLSDAKDRHATKQFIAALLELDEVLVAGAVQNTANEGATDVMAHVFTDDALLVYSNPRPALMSPSAGYTFAWTGHIGASPMGHRIKRFRMEPRASDRIEGEMAYDQKVVATDLGVFFNGVLT